MKRIASIILLSIAMLANVNAMPFEEARIRALFLTDKMAYELNLNQAQMDYAYEINLDYFLGVASPADIYGSYLTYRNNNFYHILCDWQYNIFVATEYFFRPVCWRAGSWFYPVCDFYKPTHYYYSRPRVYNSYLGRRVVHSHNNYYQGRKPHWDGGMRGRNPHNYSEGKSHGNPHGMTQGSRHGNQHEMTQGSHRGNQRGSYNTQNHNTPTTRPSHDNSGRSQSGFYKSRSSNTANNNRHSAASRSNGNGHENRGQGGRR